MAAATLPSSTPRTPVTPSDEVPAHNSKPTIFDIVVRSGFSAGLCALAAHTLSIFPAGTITVSAAAVFGGSSSVVRNALRYITAEKNEAFLTTVAKTAFIYIAAAAAGTLFTKTLGLPILFSAALQLSGILVLTSFAAASLFITCGICVCYGIGVNTLNGTPNEPVLPGRV